MVKKSRQKISIVIVVLITLFILVSIFYLFTKIPEQNSKVCVDSHCFNVQIADNAAEREKGLMFVDKLDEDKGMLFIFDLSSNHSFWMKNTLIPLDMIWIDENKTIVYIARNSQPCDEICEPIIPEKEALYVLEINSGLADKYGFKLGDSVWFHLV